MEIISAVQVKVSFNEDLRRFSLLRDATFKQLSDNIVAICNIDPNAPVVIRYWDNDKDLITMSSDRELQEAIKAVQDGSILRLNVSIKPLPVPAPSPAVGGASIALTKSATPLPVASAPPAFGPGFPMPPVGAYPTLEGELEDLSIREGPAVLPHLHPHGQQFYPFGRPFRHHRGGFHHGPAGPHGDSNPGFPPGFGGFGPHRGGFHHHHRFAHPHPHPYEFQHHDRPAFAAPPAGCTDEERKKWKEAQRAQWKDARKAWKEGWKNMSKEDREAFKMHKKEMKRHWKAEKEEKIAKREGVKLVARHVKDVTITDGTELLPGTPFLKTWKLRNDGSEAWPAGCRLLFISRKGDRMGGPDSVVVEGAVAAGQEVEISVNLVAPVEPGRYTSYYKLVTPEGIKFGQRMWVSIVVSGSSSSSSSDDDETVHGPTADMIEAMGFDAKRKHIVRLLVKHDGNADKVVQILSKKEKGCHKRDGCHKKKDKCCK